MHTARLVSVACWVVVAGALTAAAPGASAVPPQQVADAIRKGQDYLRAQEKNGSWEEIPAPDPNSDARQTRGGQWGGVSALATYALLASGENRQSESIQQAVKFVGNINMPGIYALGVRAQIWQFLPDSRDIRVAANRDFKGLERAIRGQGEARGLYFYTATEGNPSEYDHSVSQYGVLGMWALAQTGMVEVTDAYWSAVDQAWRRHQDQAGGWAYVNGMGGDQGKASAAMTAAGVATLFITKDYLHAGDVTCRGNIEDANIEGGLKWMGDHFQDVFGDGTDGQKIQWYALYGVERIGVAAGRKYLGNVNWYEAGADWLLKHQNPDGSWGTVEGMWGKNVHNVPDTSFALLFLSRGRAPVVMNKLQYEVESPNKKRVAGPWNQRPRDAANFTRWLGKQLEKDFNWQSVTLNAPVEELHDAPILYIAGSQTLNFSPPEQEKLRQFVEEGGLILGNADCSSEAFANSFRKLGTELFKSYEFRELPVDHPIFTEQYRREKWRAKPSVLGLSNGARELMLLAPTADMGRYWQVRSYGGKEEMHELPANIFLYVVDKGSLSSQFKGETYLVRRDDGVRADKSIKLARLEYPGNWDPEPAGWRRLAAVMHNRYRTDLAVDVVPLGEGKLGGYKIAHLTGTTTWKMPEPMQAELKAFVNGGGTLIVDAAGGSPAFAASIEADCAAMFPGFAAARPLPPEHPVFSATGAPLEVIYRRFARKIVGSLRTSRLRAVEIDNRPAVFYSAEDLSAGLVGQPVDGILGYEPKTATDVMADILLFSNRK